MAHLGISSFEPNRHDRHRVMKDTANSEKDEAEIERADPDKVDKEPVMSITECPNCGPHTLATVRVEDAEYIASCSSCEHDVRAPVVVGEDGGHKVDFDSEVA